MTWRFPYVTLCITGVTLVVYIAAPLTNSGADTDPFWRAVLDGQRHSELWRPLTAHWLHTDLNHLLWNGFALILLGITLEQRSRILLVISLAVGMAAVTLWFFLQNSVDYYCGWSGALNALLIQVLARCYWPPQVGTGSTGLSGRRQFYNLILVVVALGALVKGGFEFYSGQTLVSQTLWSSAPGAHLAGLAAGIGLVLATYLWRPTDRSLRQCIGGHPHRLFAHGPFGCRHRDKNTVPIR